jgi:hypothetical protein
MAGMVASHLFEQIALRMASGEMVRVMGFGSFAARWFHSPHSSSGHGVPTFCPARGLRQEVKACLLRDRVPERQVRAFRKRHRISSLPNRTSERTFTAQRQVRRNILYRNYGSIELD